MSNTNPGQHPPAICKLRERAAREHAALLAYLHAAAAVIGRLAMFAHDEALNAIMRELTSHIRAIAESVPEDGLFRAHLVATEETLKAVTARAEQLRVHITESYNQEIDLS